MKLRIGEPEKKGPIVRLVLEQREDNVTVVAIEESGAKWYLMRFNDDGTRLYHWGIPEYLGFAVDENGRLAEKGRT